MSFLQIFRLKLLKNYQPNQVHQFLKELETEGKQISIVTQNVDGLHDRSGSSKVIEYHGNLNAATCTSCGHTYPLSYVMKDKVPRCSEGGCGDVLKPDIVLFGDPITEHDQAEQAVIKSDLVLILGTSLLVTPFNNLPNYASSLGIPVGIINRESTPMDYLFDFVIKDDLLKAIKEIKAIVEV